MRSHTRGWLWVIITWLLREGLTLQTVTLLAFSLKTSPGDLFHPLFSKWLWIIEIPEIEALRSEGWKRKALDVSVDRCRQLPIWPSKVWHETQCLLACWDGGGGRTFTWKCHLNSSVPRKMPGATQSCLPFLLGAQVGGRWLAQQMMWHPWEIPEPVPCRASVLFKGWLFPSKG